MSGSFSPMGLLGQVPFDPEAMQRAIAEAQLSQGLINMGAAIAQAGSGGNGRPTWGGALAAGAQGFSQGSQAARASETESQRNTQFNRALGNAPAEYRGLLAGMGPRAGGEALFGLLQQQGDAQMMRDIIARHSGGSSAPAGGAVAPSGSPAPRAGGSSVMAPAALMPFFEEASRETGIPVPLLIAQARQESNFDVNARGRAGEVGLMQIMPSTARQPGFGLQGVDPSRLNDPRENILFGARYLAARAGQGDWNDPSFRASALGRYNGGGDPNYVQNVLRWMPGDSAPAQMAQAPVPGPQTAQAGGGAIPMAALREMAMNPRLAPRAQALASLQQREEPTISYHNIGGQYVALPNRGVAPGTVIGPAGNPQNPLGDNATANAAMQLRQLAGPVASGTATEEQRVLFRQAVDIYTNGVDRPDGSRTPGLPLPPEFRPALQRLAQMDGRPDASAAGAPGSPPGSRIEVSPSGSTREVQPPRVTQQERERWSVIETEAGRVRDAMQGLRAARENLGNDWQGALAAWVNNPQSPRAQRLNAAYNSLVTALRGPAFLNTGVLQPGEIAMIERMLLSPQSLRGLLSTNEGMDALLTEFERFVTSGLERQRRAVLGQGYADPQAPGTTQRPPLSSFNGR